ncbi:uncharacterized protein K460DRAFT_411914 [Cucurbitaria berberidis CBS 394.84]|uniref:Uncharacterized protein n=1 Tax=Cucurbitaria berberidis CBS 394.84 TaxID=1168544 RepID=A0A9P4LDJ2_9PLEO|nr:uncharacterized protein K460DRAFT_411914 [Cucurbitaria berberidis CBS 394.84]KAF1850159.1 hypothetical protein K460DRAFT_411914 [Cucurbitaria berberidis CBS 394.84]
MKDAATFHRDLISEHQRVAYEFRRLHHLPTTYRHWALQPSEIEDSKIINHIHELEFMLAAIDKKIHIACEAYNIAVCRQVSESLLQKLPRELRNLVYRYITTESVTVNDPNCDILRITQEEFPYFVNEPRSKRDPLCWSHFWRDDVLGKQFAIELVESWYRYTKFNFSRRLGSMPQYFLHQDRFNMGLHPHALVTDITKSIAVNHLFCKSAEVRERVAQDLELFSCLCPKAKLQVKLYWQLTVNTMEGRNNMKEGLKSFTRPICLLKKVGIHVTVSLIEDTTWENRYELQHKEAMIQAWLSEVEAELQAT